MGKYRSKIADALDKVRKLDPKSPDFHMEKLKIFEEVHGVIDKHINEEMHEEKDLNNLLHALINYRKHLEFAKFIMEKKVPSEFFSQEDLHKLSDLGKTPFDNRNDFRYVIMQLESALTEYHYITENLKHLLKEEKILLR